MIGDGDVMTEGTPTFQGNRPKLIGTNTDQQAESDAVLKRLAVKSDERDWEPWQKDVKEMIQVCMTKAGRRHASLDNSFLAIPPLSTRYHILLCIYSLQLLMSTLILQVVPPPPNQYEMVHCWHVDNAVDRHNLIDSLVSTAPCYHINTTDKHSPREYVKDYQEFRGPKSIVLIETKGLAKTKDISEVCAKLFRGYGGVGNKSGTTRFTPPDYIVVLSDVDPSVDLSQWPLWNVNGIDKALPAITVSG